MRWLGPLLLAVVGCGDEDASPARRFGLGSPAQARQRVESPQDNPLGNLTLRELVERNEPTTLDVSIHILLELRDDGSSTYWGPPSMGAEEARLDGHWHRSGAVPTLTPRSCWPRTSGTLAALVCPVQGDVVEIPFGDDPAADVCYGLRDLRRGAFPHPSLRIAKR